MGNLCFTSIVSLSCCLTFGFGFTVNLRNYGSYSRNKIVLCSSLRPSVGYLASTYMWIEPTCWHFAIYQMQYIANVFDEKASEVWCLDMLAHNTRSVLPWLHLDWKAMYLKKDGSALQSALMIKRWSYLALPSSLGGDRSGDALGIWAWVVNRQVNMWQEKTTINCVPQMRF